MKDVCVYDDTYDLIMGLDSYSCISNPIQDSFAMRLYCILEDYSHVLQLNEHLNECHDEEK